MIEILKAAKKAIENYCLTDAVQIIDLAINEYRKEQKAGVVGADAYCDHGVDAKGRLKKGRVRR